MISHKTGVAKIVYVHAMKVYLGRRGIVTLMLDFGTRCGWEVNCCRDPSNRRLCGLLAESVCMVWEQREAVFPAKFGTPDRPIRS